MKLFERDVGAWELLFAFVAGFLCCMFGPVLCGIG
jgi:uncharacterized membrane protein